MEENNFGKGAVKDIPDFRDYIFGRDVGMSAVPFDWEKGYDVEKVISELIGKDFKIKIKDQGLSSSCGGQAWGYYGQAINAFFDKNILERSAKFIYANTNSPGGGSGGRQNCDFVKGKGWGFEEDTVSYEGGKVPSEAFMVRKNDITEIAYAKALADKAFAYANVPIDVELIAQAVRDNHGVVIGITGTNNGSWRSSKPKAATTFENSWNHWLYIGKVKVMNGKKYFGAFNSWGEDVGDDGVQWLSEEHMLARVQGYNLVWSVWTMVMKEEVVVPPINYPLLKFKSKGPYVKQLQSILNKKINAGLVVDGDFGNKTLAKVKDFQRSYGLVVDGVVGPLTWKILLA